MPRNISLKYTRSVPVYTVQFPTIAATVGFNPPRSYFTMPVLKAGRHKSWAEQLVDLEDPAPRGLTLISYTPRPHPLTYYRARS